ncbi:MAG: PAS domain-containing protein, partial [Chloroflexi bacterium]|nr:PAS domain-containing protein [Chloroflexota bacterium]
MTLNSPELDTAAPRSTGAQPPAAARVLLVEDDPTVALTVAEVLRRGGFDVETRHTLDGGIDRLRQGGLDALVTDLRLDGKDEGVALVGLAKTADEDVVAIVLTAFMSAASAVEAVRLGAWAYLTKPCNPAELVVTLGRGLEHRHRLQALRRRAEVAEAATARAEAAQRDAEEARDWLKTVIDVMPQGVAIADASGLLVRANQAAHDSWGTAAGSSPDRPAFDYSRPDGSSYVKGELPLGRALAGETVSGEEVQVLNRTSGLLKTLLISAAPIARAGGAVSVCQDVTAQRIAREDALRSRQQLEAILAGVAEGVTVRDAQGRLIYANQAAARALRLPDPMAIIGTPQSSLQAAYDIVAEDGRPLAWSDLPGNRALRGEDAPEAVIRFHYGDEGEDHWASVKAQPIRDESGAVVMEVSIFHDVTALKRAERAQRFLAAASRELSSSLNYDDTLAAVARLAVPDLADWSILSLANETGQLRPVAIAHPDPEKEAMAWDV